MPELSIDELFAGMTEDEIRESILSTLELTGIKARSWASGGKLRTLVAVVAKTGSFFSRLIVGLNRSNFLDHAEGPALQLLAKFVYGVDKELASFATGSVTLANPSGPNIPTQQPGDVVFKHSVTGKTYENAEAFALPPLAVGVVVKVRAKEIGSASNATPGTVTQFETAQPGVTVTNPASIVGADEESDPRLRERCRSKLGTRSGLGPKTSYEYWAKSVLRADGTPVGIQMVKVNVDSGTAHTDVALAYTPGEPSGPDVAIVQAALDKFSAPTGFTATAFAATPTDVSFTWQAWAHASYGATSAEIQAAGEEAVRQLIYNYPIGGRAKAPSLDGYLWKRHVEAAIEKSHPAIFDVSSSFTDLLLAPYARPRLITQTPTVTIEVG